MKHTSFLTHYWEDLKQAFSKSWPVLLVMIFIINPLLLIIGTPWFLHYPICFCMGWFADEIADILGLK